MTSPEPLVQFHRNVPHNALYQNFTNIHIPLNKLAARAVDKIKTTLSPEPLVPCPHPECLVRGGPTLAFFVVLFLVDEGRRDPSTTISESSLACQQNAIK